MFHLTMRTLEGVLKVDFGRTTLEMAILSVSFSLPTTKHSIVWYVFRYGVVSGVNEGICSTHGVFVKVLERDR